MAGALSVMGAVHTRWRLSGATRAIVRCGAGWRGSVCRAGRHAWCSQARVQWCWGGQDAMHLRACGVRGHGWRVFEGTALAHHAW